MKLKRNVEDYDIFYLTDCALSVIHLVFTNNSKIGKDYTICYLRESNPPIAGDPIIKAKVITIPKTMPTKTKRLFMKKNYFTLVKNEMNFIQSGRIL